MQFIETIVKNNTFLNELQDSKFEKIRSRILHDINSPIAVLVQTTSALPFEERDLATRALNRILKIISYDLDFEKHEYKDNSFNKETYAETIQNIVDEKKVEFKSNKIEFEMSFTSSFLQIFHSQNKIEFERVLSNLINNAIEAIVKKNGLIKIEGSIESNFVIIKIKDNGKGIPKNIKKKLLKKRISFGKVKGKGIGLISAKDFLDKNNGEVTIESEVNKGTMVTLKLPY